VRLFRQRQNAPRIGEQPFAGVRQCHAPAATAVAREQRATERMLKPLDLLTDGGLGPVNALARAGKAAGVDNGDKTAQQVEIEHKNIH
jgi:hypothetical protein